MKPDSLHLGLVGPLPPPNGGMAMQTRQLAQFLAAEGVTVSRLATNAPYWPAFVEPIRGVRALFRLLPYLWRVWRLAGRVDVIHMMANSGWSWQLFCAPVVWAAWLRRTPVVVNYRGGEAPSYFSKSFAQVKPTLDKATVVVVPSGFLHKVFADYGAQSTVIPNIVDLDRFRPKVEKIQQDRFTLIVTRNLEKIYGIDTAIRAVAMLADGVPGISLVIAGSGPQKPELLALAGSLGIDSRVRFTGRLGPEEIAELYQSADVMLNPTTVDNMPNSVLEALACGVAVISTDVGGVPYIVQNETTALLVPVGDEKKMAAAILRLYKDEALRAQLVSAGINEAQKYSWSQVKGQWLGLYKSVARGQAA